MNNEIDTKRKVIIYLLESQGLRWEIETDPKVIMKEMKGGCVPDPDLVAIWAIKGNEKELFMFVWDVIDWINDKGFRYACGGR